MIKVRFRLMKGVNTIHDFETTMVKPKIGELISIGEDHYEVKHIQHIFDEGKEFQHLLITAIR